jgi:uncharacterized protein YijF (DUF1287 family)
MGHSLMFGRKKSLVVFPPGARQGRKRRRKRSLVIFTMFVVLTSGIAWLWYSVFEPLFEDPQDWVVRERTFREVLKEVLVSGVETPHLVTTLPKWPPPLTPTQHLLVRCAEREVARRVKLSVSYQRMDYPWGDVSAHLGASPDLLVRCLREVGLDLQQMVHQDRINHKERYPLHFWAEKRADPAIDHRRLINLHIFIKSFGDGLPVLVDSVDKIASYQPGDIVFWTTVAGGEHPGLVGIVLDKRDRYGIPFVVTLQPTERMISEHHRLTDWPLTSHFRLYPDRFLERFLEANPRVRLIPRPHRGG